MKPRARPGKVLSGGSAYKADISKAKMLSDSQMNHLRKEEQPPSRPSKVGKGGKRAAWDIDYEEGCQYATKPMPHKEPESYSEDGIRRLPKNHH